MEAWQHVKLTRTNRPCGLIIIRPLSHNARTTCARTCSLLEEHLPTLRELRRRLSCTARFFFDAFLNIHSFVSRWTGGNCGGATPDPIPNSEVKPSSADGTATLGRGRVGRCQSYPFSESLTCPVLGSRRFLPLEPSLATSSPRRRPQNMEQRPADASSYRSAPTRA